jgi:hypothetical protein
VLRQSRRALRTLGEWVAHVFVRAVAIYVLAGAISLMLIALERASAA